MAKLIAPKIILISLLLLLSVGAKCETRFSGGTDDFTDERLATKLVIGKSDAEYGTILAALGAYVAEVGFGFDVETVSLTADEVSAALERGQVDIVLNARLPDKKEWFDKAAAAGTILSTGPTYFKNGFPVSGAASTRLGVVGDDFLKALRDMEIPLNRVEETHEWFHANEIDGEHRAAIYFLWNFNYEDSWKSWMAWNPAERIREATERFTGLRYPDVYEGVEYDINRFGRQDDDD